MTEHLASTDAKVFQARARLYAERLRQRQPDTAAGYWARGYASGLSGFAADAHADLVRAAALAAPSSTSAPPWMAVVEPFGRFDDRALAKLAGTTALKRLAQLLQFVCVDDPVVDRPGRDVGRLLLADNPGCTRVRHALTRVGAIDARQRIADDYLKCCREVLPAQAAAARKAKPRALPALWGDLLHAGEADGGEPSWASLARLLQEEAFTAVTARLDALADASVAPGAFLASVQPWTEDHPQRALLSLHPQAWNDDPAGARARLLAMPTGDVQLHQDALLAAYVRGAGDHLPALLVRAAANRDAGLRDQAAYLRRSSNADEKSRRARGWLAVSPHAGAAMEALLEAEEKLALALVAAWEKEAGQQPTVLRGLARRAQRRGDLPQAEQAWRAYIARAPAALGYFALADVCLTRKRQDQWRAALDEYLRQPDQDYSHDRARAHVARALMNRGDWRDAREYVERCSDADTAWAMDCAVRYYELANNVGKAQEFVSRCAQRFPSRRFDWAFWCVRTGQGNWPTARANLETELAARHAVLSREEIFKSGVLFTLGQEPGRAADALAQLVPAEPAGMTAFLYGLACDEVGRKVPRDEAWRGVAAHESLLGQLADRCRAALEQGENGELELGVFERILAEMPPPLQLDGAYLVGRFLDTRGKQKEAIDLYQRCIAKAEGSPLIRVMAVARLRQLGLMPKPALEPLEFD